MYQLHPLGKWKNCHGTHGVWPWFPENLPLNQGMLGFVLNRPKGSYISIGRLLTVVETTNMLRKKKRSGFLEPSLWFLITELASFLAFTETFYQWIGLRENLQETMVFTIKYRGFRLKFSLHPILWFYNHIQETSMTPGQKIHHTVCHSINFPPGASFLPWKRKGGPKLCGFVFTHLSVDLYMIVCEQQWSRPNSWIQLARNKAKEIYHGYSEIKYT